MARRCKCKCRSELLPARQCTDWFEKKGYFDVDHMARHGIDKAAKIKDKERKDRNIAFKNKVNSNDASKQVETTQRVFNRWVKLEAYRLTPWCVSCRKAANLSNISDFCCGHFKTVGSHGELRFNTQNVALQCNRYCNMGLSGNINGNKTSIGYNEGLKIDLGEDSYNERINYLTKPHQNHTRDLRQHPILRKWLAGRIKRLESLIGL